MKTFLRDEAIERTIETDFKSFSNDTLQYHQYIMSLMSGIIIGMITNYFIMYFIPLPYYYGFLISVIFLITSSYIVLQYSPTTIRSQAIQNIPIALKEFLHKHFNKLLIFLQLDLEGYAFHKKAISYNGFMAQISNVKVSGVQISNHQGKIKFQYPFLRFFKSEILLKIFVTSLGVKLHRVIIDIELNRFARLHPKTDEILITLGKRLNLAIFNPQLIYPEISEKEYKEIMKDIRPYLYSNNSNYL